MSQADDIITAAANHKKRVARFTNDKLRLKKKRNKKKKHGENKERAFREQAKAKRAKHLKDKNYRERREYVAKVRAFWNGEIEEHP